MGQQTLTALSVRDSAPIGSSPPLVTPGMDQPSAGLRSRKPPSIPPPAADFQSLVNQVVYLARTLLGANGSAIAFRKGQATICSARSGEGAPSLGAPVDIGSGIFKACLESGTPLWCADITAADPEISKTVGIRAVAVAPIYCDDQISGILAVFSFVPRVFTQLHLKWLQQLASWVGSAQSMRSEKIFPARAADSYRPLHLLNDVLIETPLPWKRFVESVFLHIVAIGIVVGLSAIWPEVPLIASHPLRDAHITYYPFSQSFPTSASSRPPAPRKRRRTSARPEPANANGESAKSATRDAVTAPKLDETALPPGIPAFNRGRIPKPAIAAAVSPAPDVAEANSRQLQLPKNSIIAPPPELGGGSGLRTIDEPRAAVVPPAPDTRGLAGSAGRRLRSEGGNGGRGRDALIVPPAPSVDDGALITNSASRFAPGEHVIAAPPTLENGLSVGGKGRGVSLATRTVQIVPPPPSLTGAGNSLGSGRGNSMVAGAGGSQIVPPPPSLSGAGNSLGSGRGNSMVAGAGSSQIVSPPPSLQDARNIGSGRGGSLAAAGAGSEVVPPAPSMQEAGKTGGGRGISLGHGTSDAVGPPPSVAALAGGGSGTGGRGTALSGSPLDAALPPEAKADIPAADQGRVAKPLAPSPDLDLSHRVFQDMQLRVIGLAWAPPRSSYFSNFEVFIAQKSVNKKEAEYIKLVYVFLPYQRRLSQYGADALRTRRLRVTRDSTCDENLMEMMWPEDQNHPANPQSKSASPRRGDVLPCYITTADDYVRAVSRSR